MCVVRGWACEVRCGHDGGHVEVGLLPLCLVINRHVCEAMCYWSFITVHNRCKERVVMDNMLGCPLFWAAQETALVSAVQKVVCMCFVFVIKLQL